MSMGKQEKCFETFPDDYLVFADGYEDAIIGVDPVSLKVIYDADKCIEILVSNGMDYEDAVDYFDFNTRGAQIGERTPIFVNPI
jgi:hypothetical protein